MAEQSLRTRQGLRPLAPDLYEQEEYVEEPLFEGDDGQGPPSNPDEDEELNEGEEDGRGDGPPAPPQPDR